MNLGMRQFNLQHESKNEERLEREYNRYLIKCLRKDDINLFLKITGVVRNSVVNLTTSCGRKFLNKLERAGSW